jgi:hypothetical protein
MHISSKMKNTNNVKTTKPIQETMSLTKNREADILLTLIQERYSDRVTHEELEEIRKSLNAIIDNSSAMRAIKLENCDEPFQTFRPGGEPT